VANRIIQRRQFPAGVEWVGQGDGCCSSEQLQIRHSTGVSFKLQTPTTFLCSVF